MTSASSVLRVVILHLRNLDNGPLFIVGRLFYFLLPFYCYILCYETVVPCTFAFAYFTFYVRYVIYYCVDFVSLCIGCEGFRLCVIATSSEIRVIELNFKNPLLLN